MHSPIALLPAKSVSDLLIVHSPIALLPAKPVGDLLIVHSVHAKQVVALVGAFIRRNTGIVLPDLHHLLMDQVIWRSTQSQNYQP